MSYRFQDNLSPPFFHCSQVTFLMHYSPLVLIYLSSHLILSTTRLPYVWSPHGWSVGLSYFVPNLRSHHPFARPSNFLIRLLCLSWLPFQHKHLPGGGQIEQC